MARLKVAGKWIYLGTYADLGEAITVRREAETHYGFHARHGSRPAVEAKPRPRKEIQLRLNFHV